jgi:aminobenzoyl-glutamate utilization protein B
MLFSYAELGFQEFETSKYIVNALRQNGFTVQEGVYGFPTGWIASWGSGKPVIALSADLDCLPEASQKPGVAYHDPIIDGAPGHGEGHNSGPAVQLTAAIALKKIMEREHISGTIRLWPGVGNEPNGGKAWFVRDGFFKDVDVDLHSHVGSNFGCRGAIRRQRAGTVIPSRVRRLPPPLPVAGPQCTRCGRATMDVGRTSGVNISAVAVPPRHHQW